MKITFEALSVKKEDNQEARNISQQEVTILIFIQVK